MSTEQITDAIINYFDNGVQDAHEIKGLLLLDHNQEVGLDFIIEIINETIGYSDDVSNEGFDPYLNCYTDDC